MLKKVRKTIYLDHAAATPLHPLAKKVMEPFLTSAFGNPSSLHHKGAEAKNAIEESRKTISEIIGARVEEIVFTSGGTEACNLAILGIAGRELGHIITSAIEHHAVHAPTKILKKQGWKVTYLPVDGQGFVSVDGVKKAIKKDTILVSVMYANNEIGTIEPIAEIGRLISGINIERQQKGLLPIAFHTDACQAASSLDLNVNRLGVDLMSVSASKIYGPKGAGFLYVRKGTLIHPVIHGGGQERGLRSGTENAAGIVGMAKALELVVAHRDRENKRLISLRDYLIKQTKKSLPEVILNGPIIKQKQVSPKVSGRLKMGIQGLRLSNNINFTIPGAEGEALMFYLDAYGICVSTGSACATGSTDASHVLLAIGRTKKQAKESIRITLGRDTKKGDLDYTIKAIKTILKFLRI